MTATAYLVVKEYREKYAPGNIMGGEYWQHYDTMRYYVDVQAARKQRFEWVSEQLKKTRCKFCPQRERVKIYHLKDGQSLKFPNPDPYADDIESDTSDLWTKEELKEGKEYELEGYLGCKHCPLPKKQENTDREVHSLSRKFEGFQGCHGPQGDHGPD